MITIFVNLKRFDVPADLGGLCRTTNGRDWLESVLHKSSASRFATQDGLRVVYLLPESLLLIAAEFLNKLSLHGKNNISFGSQTVYRKDVGSDNFGAFTANLPAAAAKSAGCTWAMVGHSEERKDKQELATLAMDKDIEDLQVKHRVNAIIGRQARNAVKRDLNLIVCVGENAEEYGNDISGRRRVKEALKRQLAQSLDAVFPTDREVFIGYEPIWAIGPGKTPPGTDYIQFVSKYIKETVRELYGVELPVVYGGGLKRENAEQIVSLDSIDGGLVALTKFTDPIGFSVNELDKIIAEFI